MSHVFLKIKLKSLAAEARIIRHEERKSDGDRRCKLHHHRVGEVRREARATHLAYGFLRGIPRLSIERKARTEPDWDKIERMAGRYGDASRFADWQRVE